MLAALVLSTYLVVKVTYNEVYPCYWADKVYSDYGATQYHNLFRRDF